MQEEDAAQPDEAERRKGAALEGKDVDELLTALTQDTDPHTRRRRRHEGEQEGADSLAPAHRLRVGVEAEEQDAPQSERALRKEPEPGDALSPARTAAQRPRRHRNSRRRKCADQGSQCVGTHRGLPQSLYGQERLEARPAPGEGRPTPRYEEQVAAVDHVALERADRRRVVRQGGQAPPSVAEQSEGRHGRQRPGVAQRRPRGLGERGHPHPLPPLAAQGRQAFPADPKHQPVRSADPLAPTPRFGPREDPPRRIDEADLPLPSERGGDAEYGPRLPSGGDLERHRVLANGVPLDPEDGASDEGDLLGPEGAADQERRPGAALLAAPETDLHLEVQCAGGEDAATHGRQQRPRNPTTAVEHRPSEAGGTQFPRPRLALIGVMLSAFHRPSGSWINTASGRLRSSPPSR
ncbi:MAG: hypothetical protein D6731_09865 [Planctomycetota bacterium]|nr:MAG: hypothetical protein D6731_09865 [Planctomycetota bacterium]